MNSPSRWRIVHGVLFGVPGRTHFDFKVLVNRRQPLGSLLLFWVAFQKSRLEDGWAVRRTVRQVLVVLLSCRCLKNRPFWFRAPPWSIDCAYSSVHLQDSFLWLCLLTLLCFFVGLLSQRLLQVHKLWTFLGLFVSLGVNLDRKIAVQSLSKLMLLFSKSVFLAIKIVRFMASVCWSWDSLSVLRVNLVNGDLSLMARILFLFPIKTLLTRLEVRREVWPKRWPHLQVFIFYDNSELFHDLALCLYYLTL